MTVPREPAEILSTVGRVFRRTWPHLFAFNLLFSLIALIGLGPISAWIIGTMIATTGHQILANEEIISFFLSLRGAITLVLILVSALVTFSANLSGMMLIGAGPSVGERITFMRALGLVLKRLPRGISTTTIQVMAVLAYAIPFAAVGAITFRIMTEGYDINFLLEETPPRFWVGIGIGLGLLTGFAILSYFLYTRWVFALPVFLFEGKQDLNALRRSRQLARRRRPRTVLLTLGWWGLWFILLILVTALFDGVGWLLYPRLGSRMALIVAATGLLAGLFVLVQGILLFLGPAVASLLLFAIYQDLRRLEGSPLTSVVGPAAETEWETETTWKLPRGAAWTVSAVALFALTGIGIRLLSLVEIRDRVEITAHRGSSLRAPENSLGAIRLAIEEGADFAEIDVQQTADGVVVLTHDRDLRRVAGDERRINDIRWRELRSLDTGSWFSSEYAGEPIPRLEDVIELARDRIRLNVELKYYGFEESLAESVVRILREEDFASQAVISSLNREALLQVEALAPEIRTGLIVAEAYGKKRRPPRGIDFFSLNRKIVTRKLVERLHRLDRDVHVWTLNDRRSMNRYINLGVDNILTDDPELLVELLRERAGMNDLERALLRFKVLLWN